MLLVRYSTLNCTSMRTNVLALLKTLTLPARHASCSSARGLSIAPPNITPVFTTFFPLHATFIDHGEIFSHVLAHVFAAEQEVGAYVARLRQGLVLEGGANAGQEKVLASLRGHLQSDKQKKRKGSEQKLRWESSRARSWHTRTNALGGRGTYFHSGCRERGRLVRVGVELVEASDLRGGGLRTRKYCTSSHADLARVYRPGGTLAFVAARSALEARLLQPIIPSTDLPPSLNDRFTRALDVVAVFRKTGQNAEQRKQATSHEADTFFVHEVDRSGSMLPKPPASYPSRHARAAPPGSVHNILVRIGKVSRPSPPRRAPPPQTTHTQGKNDPPR